MIRRGKYRNTGKDYHRNKYHKKIDAEKLYSKIKGIGKRYEGVDSYYKKEKVDLQEEDLKGYEGCEEELKELAKEENYELERLIQPERNRLLQEELRDEEVKKIHTLTTTYMVQKGYILPRVVPLIYTELFVRYYKLKGNSRKFLPIYKSVFEKVCSRGDLGYLINKVQSNSLKGWESVMGISKEFVKDDERVKVLLYSYYPYLEGFIREGIDVDWGEGRKKVNKNKVKNNRQDYISNYDIVNKHIESLENGSKKLNGKSKGIIDDYQKELYKALWVAIKREFLGGFRSDKVGEVTVYSEWVMNRNTILHGRLNPNNIHVEELYSMLAVLDHLHIYKRYLNGEDIREGNILGFYGHKKGEFSKELLYLIRKEDVRDGSFDKPYYKGTMFSLFNDIEERMEFNLKDFHVETHGETIKDWAEEIIEENERELIDLEGCSIVEIDLDIGIGKEDVNLDNKEKDTHIELGIVTGEGEIIREGMDLYLTRDDIWEDLEGATRIFVRRNIYIDIPQGHEGLRLKVTVGDNEKYISLY